MKMVLSLKKKKIKKIAINQHMGSMLISIEAFIVQL